jgi:hypothetical protein
MHAISAPLLKYVMGLAVEEYVALSHIYFPSIYNWLQKNVWGQREPFRAVEWGTGSIETLDSKFVD